MKRKIVEIFVMMLLVATAVLPLVNSLNDTNKEDNVSVFTNESKVVSSIKNTNQGCPISIIQDLNGDGTCEVDECIGRLWPYEGTLSAAANYHYVPDDADGYPIIGPDPKKDHSKWFFYNGSDGLSLMMIHENATSGDGGDVNLSINVSIGPPGYIPANPPNVVVADDPNELRLDDSGVHDFIGRWHFTSGNNGHSDGGVIGNLSCYMMWIEVTPDIWVDVDHWQFWGYNEQGQEEVILLDKNLKTCFLCGWKNCIAVDKTVTCDFINFADEISVPFPADGRCVWFKISIYVGCSPKVGGIDIPYSSIIVKDFLDSNEFHLIGSEPLYTSDDPNTNVFEWDLGQIDPEGILRYGDHYDILLNATIRCDDDIYQVYQFINNVLVESLIPPGCCESSSAEDSATIWCSNLPLPDLLTNGSLSWDEIKPSSTITGVFQVINIGEEESLLSWEITEYPKWGTWSFDPSSGDNLKPEEGPVEVEVEVETPDEEDSNFTGNLKIVNRDNSSDYCTIPVSLSTPENTGLTLPLWIQWLEKYCPLLFHVLQELLNM